MWLACIEQVRNLRTHRTTLVRELRAECGRLSARLRTAKRAIAHRDEACTDAQVRVTLRVIAVSLRSLDLSACV